MISSEIQKHYCRYCRQIVSSEHRNKEFCQNCLTILSSSEGKDYIFLNLKQISDIDCNAICSAIDYVSMRVANANNEKPYYGLSDKVYRKTKKDVFEYKRKTAREALQDLDVANFAVKHHGEIFVQIQHAYHFHISKINEFDKYIIDCLALQVI